MSKPYSPLFVIGPARSGTTLLARILAASADIALLSDPYLPLFRSFRNAALRHRGVPFDPDSPLQDYYFTDERIRALDAVQSCDLQLSFDPAERQSLLEAVAKRATHESAALASHLGDLDGRTYEELFDSALAVVAAVCGRAPRWVGCKEVWTIEFVTALARAYPDARFVVILRDPRAIVASLVALGARDPAQAAHPLSYARHWRKQVAFCFRYAEDPLLSGRFQVITYERLVQEPRETALELCEFLAIRTDEEMLELGGWPGNSSYAGTKSGIYEESRERWRQSLEPHLLDLVELVCGPDLEAAGYAASEADSHDERVLDYLVASDRFPYSWRSDLGDPARDHELELERHALLAGEAPPNPGLMRRFFLFEEAFARLALAGVEQ